ncbi:MAG: AMP-binding protein, partial [Deltaproteobacteria bacterium]
MPINFNLKGDEIKYILNNSGAAALITTPFFHEIIRQIRSDCPRLSHLILTGSPSDKGVISFDQLMQSPIQSKQIALEGSDPAAIIYTSGTTGVPKGVMLTHANLISELSDLTQTFHLAENDTILSFLPYAHIFARVEHFLGIAFGWTAAFAESIPKLVDNLSEIKPTFMLAVPRIYEKVYNKIISDVSAASTFKKKIFAWCLEVGKRVSQRKQKRLPIPPLLNVKYQIAKRLVFNKLERKFGGRIRFFVSGGAPLSRDISEFFHAAGFLILEGYGLTETTAAAFTNREENYEFGTVGPPLGDIEVKINPDGEILLKGTKIFKGYFNNPEATKECFSDGWFCTGDIGILNERGHLKITDRKKDLIVTSGGKNIAPQKIENLLKTERFISQVMVYG